MIKNKMQALIDLAVFIAIIYLIYLIRIKSGDIPFNPFEGVQAVLNLGGA